ncbi:lipoyl(octanoyl) transferase LipB [Catenovulum sp. SM1970]|uniref:lipoyl(octanoyl) transferase LipB n=1 Tax=Marinifaba aquimaris TaxID=2741323 RepID=UPI001574BFF2|nr:lipoyl(octanoyl) transferase LipB [Marinifaba aquimaris]NTS78110.1 lipoyl(octanoyl) transferase LipB [Marinifaba aquimaris]
MTEALLSEILVRDLGRQPYEPIWQAMQDFTANRQDDAKDEIWFVEHDPVFTQGQAGKSEHVLFPGDIPVVQVDRGGQVTYHGPGQLVAYVLINIRRKKISVRDLVSAIENAIVAVLKDHKIDAYPKADAPGVYVDDKKIASLGLRIRRGCSFHGLALNVNMDLAPFGRINPCGYQGLEMTQCAILGGPDNLAQAKAELLTHLKEILAYSQHTEVPGVLSHDN